MKFPRPLMAPLFAVDSDLLVSRYNLALAALTGKQTRLLQFHIDAMGFSPEVAVELEDPDYLGHGRCCAIVSVAQLAAPIVQPNAGAAAGPFRASVAALGAHLATLTVQEPVFGELDHGVRPTHPRDLARVRSLSVSLETPSKRIDAAQRLSHASRSFLSTAMWRDDTFIERMLELSRRARGLRLPEGAASMVLPVGSFFTPRFDGAYVYRPAGAEEACYVLGGGAAARAEPDKDGCHVTELPLEPERVVQLLLEQGLAIFAPHHHRAHPESIRSKMHWIALDRLLSEHGDQHLSHLGGVLHTEIERWMRTHPCPPSDYMELEEAQHTCSEETFAALTPLNQLRLLSPTCGEAERFVKHLIAFLDPIDLDQLYWDAPDLFFARYASLRAPQRRYFVARLDARKVGRSWSSSTSDSGSPLTS